MSVIVSAMPIAVDGATAAAMLGNMGKSTFLEHVSRGRMPRPRKLGRRSMWLVTELQEAARQLAVSDDLKDDGDDS